MLSSIKNLYQTKNINLEIKKKSKFTNYLFIIQGEPLQKKKIHIKGALEKKYGWASDFVLFLLVPILMYEFKSRKGILLMESSVLWKKKGMTSSFLIIFRMYILSVHTSWLNNTHQAN